MFQCAHGNECRSPVAPDLLSHGLRGVDEISVVPSNLKLAPGSGADDPDLGRHFRI